MNLLDETKHLMATRNVNVSEMCRELKIALRWYYSVLDGTIPNPGIKNLQAVHDYLKRSPKKGRAA